MLITGPSLRVNRARDIARRSNVPVEGCLEYQIRELEGALAEVCANPEQAEAIADRALRGMEHVESLP